MPLLDLQIPSLADTLRTVKRAFKAEYANPQLDAFRPTNLLYPFTTVLGYLQQQLYLLMREQASQATPFGATGSNLDDWLEVYGVTVPGESRATGAVQVTGENNKTIPAGTELLRIDDGLILRTTAAVTFGAGPSAISVGVEAEYLGAEYNTEAGEKLELALIDDDIDPTAISEGIDGGADPADEEAKQALMRTRLSQSRIAGSAKDYELLTLGFSASIARVFVEPAGLGPGTVVIFPIDRNADGAEFWELTIPSTGELAALQAYLERPDVARVNDRIRVRRVTLRDVPISVAVTPNSAEVQGAIRKSLRRRFYDSYDTGGYAIPNSELSGAISAAEGEVSHTLIDIDGQGPAANATAAFGEILQVGAIAFTAEP